MSTAARALVLNCGHSVPDPVSGVIRFSCVRCHEALLIVGFDSFTDVPLQQFACPNCWEMMTSF